MSLICFRRLAMGWFVLCLTVSLSSSSSKADELSDLKSKVTQLELQVDEQKTLIETLKRERDESRREVQRLKGNHRLRRQRQPVPIHFESVSFGLVKPSREPILASSRSRFPNGMARTIKARSLL